MNKIKTFIIILILFILYSPFITPIKYGFISGYSMMSTLRDGQFIIETEINSSEDIYYGSIITADVPSNSNIFTDTLAMKRVIGKPYDQIDIIKDKVYRNGVLLNEVYLDPSLNHTSKSRHIVLDENEYFIMGDNRSNSYDGSHFGVVTYDQLRGILRYVF